MENWKFDKHDSKILPILFHYQEIVLQLILRVISYISYFWEILKYYRAILCFSLFSVVEVQKAQYTPSICRFVNYTAESQFTQQFNLYISNMAKTR